MKRLFFIIPAYILLDGFVLPPLISAKNDDLFFVGLGILGLSVIGAGKSIYDAIVHHDTAVTIKNLK